LDGDGHVTEEVYKEQADRIEREATALEQSRTDPRQRLDGEGNPANLFELLKKDPKKQGYRLEKVFFLELTHGLMGLFPAVIHAKRRVVMCLDRSLLVEVWKTLKPRDSKISSYICYINEQKGIAYSDVDGSLEQEDSMPIKILTRNEYEVIRREAPNAIAWAPGLLGGRYLEPAHFSDYVDKMAASCK
jgi:hypothetical protein